MSLLFNRNYRLEIESNGTLTTITQLRIQFLCKKNRATTANELTVKVFNPNQDTISQSLASGATIRLYAGYNEEIKLISQSQITNAYPTKQGVDNVLTIESLDGAEDIKRTKVSLSFQRGATVKQVLDAIVKALQMPVNIAKGVDTSISFNNGYAYAGGVAGALDEVLNRCNAKWSVLNGVLTIIGLKNGTTQLQAVFLSEETGMIETPTPVEDAVNSLTIGEVKKGWKVKSLLQGDINPADIIAIESRFVKGEFVIESVEHKGDTHSKEWLSEVICYDR